MLGYISMDIYLSIRANRTWEYRVIRSNTEVVNRSRGFMDVSVSNAYKDSNVGFSILKNTAVSLSELFSTYLGICG